MPYRKCYCKDYESCNECDNYFYWKRRKRRRSCEDVICYCCDSCGYEGRCKYKKPRPVYLDANLAPNITIPLTSGSPTVVTFQVSGSQSPSRCYDTSTGTFTIPRCGCNFYGLTTNVTFDATDATIDANVMISFHVNGVPIGSSSQVITQGTVASVDYTRYRCLDDCDKVQVVVMSSVSGLSVVSDSHFGVKS